MKKYLLKLEADYREEFVEPDSVFFDYQYNDRFMDPFKSLIGCIHVDLDLDQIDPDQLNQLVQEVGSSLNENYLVYRGLDFRYEDETYFIEDLEVFKDSLLEAARCFINRNDEDLLIEQNFIKDFIKEWK